MPRYTQSHSLKLLKSVSLPVILAAIASTSACSSVMAPCLAYTPTSQIRTVSLRGHGFIQMSEEKMVCTERAEVVAAD